MQTKKRAVLPQNFIQILFSVNKLIIYMTKSSKCYTIFLDFYIFLPFAQFGNLISGQFAQTQNTFKTKTPPDTFTVSSGVDFLLIYFMPLIL